MSDVAIELEERAGVEQLFDALAGEQLSLLALPFNGALAAGMPRLLAQFGQFPQLGTGRIGFRGHDASVSRPRLTCRESLVRVKENPPAKSPSRGNRALALPPSLRQRPAAAQGGILRHSYIDRPRRIRAPRASSRSRGRFLPAVVALPVVAVLWVTVGLPVLSQVTGAGGGNRLARSVVFAAQATGSGGRDSSVPQTEAAAIVSEKVLA